MPSRARVTKVGSMNFIGTQAQERIQNEIVKIFTDGTHEELTLNIFFKS